MSQTKETSQKRNGVLEKFDKKKEENGNNNNNKNRERETKTNMGLHFVEVLSKKLS